MMLLMVCFRYLLWVAMDNGSEVNEGGNHAVQDVPMLNSKL
jgi:hypothetical protein